MLRRPMGFSEGVRLWLRCLSLLAEAEASVGHGVRDEEEGPLLQARHRYASLLQLLRFLEARPGGAPYTFKRRSVRQAACSKWVRETSLDRPVIDKPFD